MSSTKQEVHSIVIRAWPNHGDS